MKNGVITTYGRGLAGLSKKEKQGCAELPKGIIAKDLSYPDTRKGGDYFPDYKDLDCHDHQFEIWYVRNFGWCIPTLDIGGAGRQATRRTYAVAIDTGKVVRIGKGPHVTECHRVYVRASRLTELRKFIDLRTKGAGDAGSIRDRISTRRAQGQQERAAGNHSWRWNS
jgi:hypothetical protein